VVVAYPTNLKVTMLTIDEGDGMGLEERIYVTTFLKSENVKTKFCKAKVNEVKLPSFDSSDNSNSSNMNGPSIRAKASPKKCSFQEKGWKMLKVERIHKRVCNPQGCRKGTS
jgi:hypothetical protein